MQHIGGPLKKFLKSSGLEKGVAQQNAMEAWANVVGENVSMIPFFNFPTGFFQTVQFDVER